MNKPEWLMKIQEWIQADDDDGERDTATLELSESGLSYHDVWKAVEASGYEQEDLALGADEKVESITFIQKPEDAFQLVLEYSGRDAHLWLVKYYF